MVNHFTLRVLGYFVLSIIIIIKAF